VKEKPRPTGIIRTLPGNGPDDPAIELFEDSIARLEKGGDNPIYIAMSQKPTHDVLHLYLVIGGEIKVRLNIAGYEDGAEVEPLECWDGVTRRPKFWAVCTAPVSRPPEPIKRRGFQGFRYTTDLW
jgi:hypothetical protein